MKTNLWENYSDEKRKIVDDFCSEYKEFLNNCKTERETIQMATKMADRNNFKCLQDLMKSNTKLKMGDKVYSINMNKSVIFFIVGKKPIEDGINIIGAHIDSPRLDLKTNPFYESQGFCMLDTHYYGGIKKYQWTAQPLALHGIVVRKDGTSESFVFGEGDDPVVGISDLLPHLEKDDKKDIKGEDLNLIAGNIADNTVEQNKYKSFIFNILKKKNISEEDFFSAEIEVVPAGRAKDFGLDSSMIMGYGHDDKVCAYTGLKALLDIESPEYSTMCILVDKEEVGSVGATGMHSKYFENCLAEIMNLCGQYSELALRRALNNSNMLSGDVTAGIDPNYISPFNLKTDAKFAHGVSFNKYTGAKGKSNTNDANAEFIAKIRNCLDKENITYQATEMGKVDQGGGGTIAYIMAKYGMNVIDAGIPVLNMHAPWEIVSKVDVYEAYRCYKAFYNMSIK